MTGRWAQRGSDRIAPAIAALIVNAVIGYALIMGLRAVPLLQVPDEAAMALFDLMPPVPEEEPPPVERDEVDDAGAEGAPAPAAAPTAVEKPVPTPVVAPPPIVQVPAPLPAAPPPPAPVPGDSTGAGGAGAGSGSGSGGSGAGAGSGNGRGSGEGGSFSRAKQTGGSFRRSDFPDGLRGVGRVRIGVRYTIGPAGRVNECEVIDTSGYGEIDALTCRVIMERYRFRPARDPEGYAVSEVREEDYRWVR